MPGLDAGTIAALRPRVGRMQVAGGRLLPGPLQPAGAFPKPPSGAVFSPIFGLARLPAAARQRRAGGLLP